MNLLAVFGLIGFVGFCVLVAAIWVAEYEEDR